jgi:VWFA-related protein
MRPLARIAVLFLLLPILASAQVKEAITVSVVEVPVTVVDREGNPVRGLTAANFQLFEDGKSRPITAIDQIDFASSQSMTAISPMNPTARRNFMILFDLTFSSPLSIARAQQAARDFVSKSVERRDRVAVATIDVQKGFRLLAAFTSDRKLVAGAIENPQSFRGNDPLQIAGSIPWSEQGSTMSGGDSRDAAANAEFNDMLRRARAAEDQYNRQKIDREVGLLAGLAKTLRSVPGQKHIVFLTEGFDPRLVQGRDAGITWDQVRENDAIEHGRIWEVDSDARYGNTATMSIVDRMAQAFRRSDVVLHAIDIKGVRGDADAQNGIEHQSNEGLYILANPTGGTVLKNVNSIETEFTRFLKRQEVIYVLAFQAPTREPGKFHDLKVKVVDVPGARVSARAGYYETGAENAAERSLSNAEIVVNDIPQDAVHFASLIAPFPTAGQNAQVPVVLEINGPDLIEAVKGNGVTAEVFVYAFDEQGLARDSLYQRIGLDLAKVGTTLRASGVKFYGVLSLPPGSYAVKMLVRVAETDRKGYSRSDIVVPRPTDVAVSQPFFFESPGKWLMIKGASHDKTNSPYPFEVNGDMFIPRAAVRVKSGDPSKFAVFVQNASPDDVTLETSPAAKVLSRVKSVNGAKLVMQLDGIAADASSMNVTLRTKAGVSQQTSTIPIHVE